MKRAILLATAAIFAASPVLAFQAAQIGSPASATDVIRVALSSPAHDYVVATSQVNTAEIEAAKLAETKSSNADVKQYAAMMIKDHTAAEAKLKAAVHADMGKMSPPGVTPKDAALKKQLQAASGAAFDRMYIDAMVDGHTQALKMQQAYAQDGDDARLKMLAGEMATTVAEHLEHAKMIAAKLPAKSS